MMIIADFVRELERLRYRRHQAFIAQAGGEGRYCVAPRAVGCIGYYPLVALYEDKPFENGLYATTLSLPAPGQNRTLHTTLDNAVRLISFLSDQSEWLDKLPAIATDVDDEAALALFGIDIERQCRASVGAWEAGEFLAPHNDGYAYFLVDLRGEIDIQSWSETVLPVALHLFADREGQRVKLSARVGKMAV